MVENLCKSIGYLGPKHSPVHSDKAGRRIEDQKSDPKIDQETITWARPVITECRKWGDSQKRDLYILNPNPYSAPRKLLLVLYHPRQEGGEFLFEETGLRRKTYKY